MKIRSFIAVAAIVMTTASSAHAGRAGDIIENDVAYNAQIHVDSLLIFVLWTDESLTTPDDITRVWRRFSFGHATGGGDLCTHEVRVNARPESFDFPCGNETYHFELTVVDEYRGLVTLFTIGLAARGGPGTWPNKPFLSVAAERVEELSKYNVTRVDANGREVKPSGR